MDCLISCGRRMRQRVGETDPYLRFLLIKPFKACRNVMVREVFMAAIAMCRERIIQRGRLGANDSKPRFPIFLEKASEGLRQLRGVQNKAPCQRLLKKLVCQMDSYREKYKNSEGEGASLDEHLAEIIDECRKLRKIPNWKRILLNDLDGGVMKMNPKELKTLVNMVEKMSQYRDSAERLVSIFRNQPVVRRASTVVVRLDDSAFTRSRTESSHAQDVLARIATSNGANLNFKRLAQKLGYTESKANKLYQTSLENALENSRVHAEMQLIWYLDSHPSQTPPRILASNKDACYLCNTLISLHGIYTVPRSHGRVYPGWRLPATDMGNIHERFARKLEKRIASRARGVLHGVKKLDHPLESTVNSSIGSLTTMLTVEEPSGQEDSSDSGSEATIRPDDYGGGYVEAASKSSPDTPLEKRTGAVDSGVSAVDFAGRAAGADVADDGRDSPMPHRESSATHDDGGSWSFVAKDREVSLQLSERLRLHVGYSAATASGGLRFRARQVSPEAAASFAAAGETVYDVHHELHPLQDVACRANSGFVNLRAGGDVFRVELG